MHNKSAANVIENSQQQQLNQIVHNPYYAQSNFNHQTNNNGVKLSLLLDRLDLIEIKLEQSEATRVKECGALKVQLDQQDKSFALIIERLLSKQKDLEQTVHTQQSQLSHQLSIISELVRVQIKREKQPEQSILERPIKKEPQAPLSDRSAYENSKLRIQETKNYVPIQPPPSIDTV